MYYGVHQGLSDAYGFAEPTDLLDLPDMYGEEDELPTPAEGLVAWAERANNPTWAGWFAASVAGWEAIFRRNQSPLVIGAKVAVAYGGYRLVTAVLAEGPAAINDREQWLSIALVGGGIGYCMLSESGRANVYER